ncbi:DNA repair protein RAD50 [Cyclospora cayetanensis]|uniref:DNA repair protein RAD50 n=1 Tax=Cyclospora cayetanensis TaxID=88456 RepID=A0A6P6RZ23_9EIME|nr:DNA repair protein RAD50 [Cyclospora cayetanensis]
MTTIERVGIQGVRSFGPESLETISFGTPLTVIVGHNGAGKTTLVECLKYALTGEMPPSADRGKGWLFDPRLTDSPEVKAQIRVSLRQERQKKRILVVRSMQLSHTLDKQRRLKPQFKALEAVLQVKDEDGQTASISHKCVNIDEQLSSLLGISKPVLEHVVLCHQEESCWPMGDMQSLKKRFDSLFDATRYVKALQAIRAAKKVHATELKDRENDLRILGVHRDAAKALQLQLQQQQEAIDAAADDIAQQQQELLRREAATAAGDEVLKRVQQLQQQLLVAEEMEALQQQKLQELQKQLERQQRRQQQEEGEEEIDDAPVVFEEPLEELEELLGTISQEYKAKSERRQAVSNKVNALQEQQLQLQQQLQQEVAKAADGLKAEERRDAARQQQRTLLDKLAAVLPYSQQHLQQAPQEAISLCAAESQKLRRQQAAAAKELHVHLQQRQHILQQLQQKEQQQQAAVSASLSLRSHLQQQLQQLQQKLLQLPSTQQCSQAVRTSEVQLQQLQRDAEAHDEAQITRLEALSATCGESLQQLQQRRQELQASQHALRQHEALGVSLQVAQQLLQQKQDLLQQKQALLQQKLAALPDWKSESSQDLRRVEQQLAAAAAAAANEWQQQQKQQQAADDAASRSTAKTQLLHQQLAAAAASCMRLAEQAQIAKCLLLQSSSSSSSSSIPCWKAVARWNVAPVTTAAVTQLQRCQHEETQLREQVCEGGHKQRWFRGLAAEAAVQGSCPLCCQSLGGSAGVEVLHQNVERRLSQLLPEAQQQIQKQLDAAHTQLQQLQQDGQTVQQLAAKHKELLASAEALDLHQQVEEDLHAAAAAAAACAAAAAEKAHDLEAAHAEALGAVEASSAVAASRHEVDAIDAKLRAAAGLHADVNTGSSSSSGELQQQLNHLEAQIAEAFADREAAQQQLQQLQRRQLERQQQELQLKAHLTERQRMLLQITEMEQQQEQLQRRLEDAIAASLQQEQQKMEEAEAAVSAATESTTGVRLQQLRQRQQELTAALQQEQQHQEQLNAAFDKGQQLLQHVRDSIDVKRQQQQLQQAEEAAAKLRVELQEAVKHGVNALKGHLEPAATHVQHQQITAEALESVVNLLRKRTTETGQALAELRGAIAAREERRQQLRQDLNSATYKRIDARYLEDCEAERLAVQDIDKYHKALDRALMSYHSAKLWQTVYSGADIDTIAIRSAVATGEETTQQSALMNVGGVAAGERSYNYRVVMRSPNGKEIDMRGRCSAGQKVLASLVIRLALAECFCASCQLLALDEPTTNLDMYNCESLAKALARLVKARQGSRSFQLLLITHDESFVYKLGREGLCDTYLKVRKDSNGRSKLSSAVLHV